MRARFTLAKLVPHGAGGMVLLLVVPTVLAITVLAVLLGGQFEDKQRADALDSAERSAEVFASLTIGGDEFDQGRLRSRETFDDIEEAIKANNSVVAVRLHTSPRQAIYASRQGLDRDPDSAGEVRRAFAGETTSGVTTFPGGAEALAVNLPVYAPGRVRPALVATLYLPYSQTRAAIARQIHRTRLLIAGVALLLLMVTIPLTVRGARSLAGGRRHVGFQRELSRALERDELVLHYQPQVDLLSGMVVGSEALVRWQHPEQGLLGPERFIARAEETGQIHALTMRVFDRALEQVAAWQLAGVELPPVAVNLSPSMLTDPDLPLRLAALLERHRVSATDVVIEMTESSMTANADEAQRMLARLDELGFRLSIDDFGTGYSSLARLDQLPLTEMKIDRSFVARMAAGGTGRLVKTMIDLAHDLGMRVVGEGVETEEVAAVLADAGCDLAQGYHYARPMTAAELAEWLGSRNQPAAATSARSPSPSTRA